MSLKGRGPVEHLNRQRKARMIEAFLEDHYGGLIKNYSVLDVGCGNGQISEYFALNNSVHGVDVEDKRNEGASNFKFNLIRDEELPFGEGTFDIVVSHHVIEHVSDQAMHLSEIKRVLKPEGCVYIGCPNKGSPFMAGHVGNEMVLTWNRAIDLFENAGFEWCEYYTRLLSSPDKYFCELTLGKYVPKNIIKLFKNWYPSHCFVLKPG